MTSTSVSATRIRPHPADPNSTLTPNANTNTQKSADNALKELLEVRDVERVLAPVCVTLITLSNLTLLVHEVRVVFRSRRLIPPKLLVMVLASTDLLATLSGFLPLWLLSVEWQKPEVGESPGTLHERAHSSTVSYWSSHLEASTASHRSNWLRQLTAKRVSHLQVNQSIATSGGYTGILFLLTAFWTMAQCIVVVMGVERFLALRAPFFYTARCTICTFCIVLGALTLASSGIAGFHVTVHVQEVKQHHLPVFAGFLDSQSLAHNVFTLVQGLLWTCVLLMCNWGVTRELQRMEECVTVMRMKDEGDYMKQLSMLHGAGREFARFMMAVNLLFLLSSCPNLFCVLLRLCNLAPTFSVQYFCWRMSHISALLNPFLYGFLRKSVRNRIRRFLNQHVKCLRPRQVGEMDTAPEAQFQNDQRDPNRLNRNPAIDLRDPEASTVHLSD